MPISGRNKFENIT